MWLYVCDVEISDLALASTHLATTDGINILILYLKKQLLWLLGYHCSVSVRYLKESVLNYYKCSSVKVYVLGINLNNTCFAVLYPNLYHRFIH